MSLPPFEDLNTDDKNAFLDNSFGILFEPSSILSTKLVPNIVHLISTRPDALPQSYSDLVDLSIQDILDDGSWNPSERSDFIAGHPRIGEVSNLSALSAAEQASKKTPLEVLARLEYLNARYEEVYPGLRYITFVNGRSRAEIVPEIERALGLQEGEEKAVVHYDRGSLEWVEELNRAIKDVGLIAKARLQGMGRK